MATEPKVGRSREELNAAAAALTGAAHEVDCSDAAAFLGRRARQFESEAMDAPPMSAAGEVSDDRLLVAITTLYASGIATGLMYLGGPAMTGEVAGPVASRLIRSVLDDPTVRLELIQSVRSSMAGRCACGGDHDAATTHHPRPNGGGRS